MDPGAEGLRKKRGRSVAERHRLSGTGRYRRLVNGGAKKGNAQSALRPLSRPVSAGSTIRIFPQLGQRWIAL